MDMNIRQPKIFSAHDRMNSFAFSSFCCLAFFACNLLVVGNSQAQDVFISQVDLQPNGDVIVRYDLKDDRIDRRYSIYLYSSADNYIQPLTKLDGDVGIDISVGGNKSITWHAKEELGEAFQGDIALELKGNIYIPFISLDGFDEYKVLKKEKPYELTWTGGRGDNVLLFELYDEDSKVKVFEERPNIGNTTIIIPKDVKSGSYHFKISDSRNRDEVVFTKPFLVKAKVPFVLKAGLGLAVLGGIGYLVSSIGGDAGQEEAKYGDPPKPE